MRASEHSNAFVLSVLWIVGSASKHDHKDTTR